jgi:hypothetical protein
VDTSTPFEANSQTAETVEPRIRGLKDSVRAARATAVGLAASSNRSRHSCSVQRSTILVVIMSAIGIDPVKPAKRLVEQIPDRRDERERRTVGVGGDVVSGTGAHAIGGVRSSFSSAPTALPT